MRKKLYSAPVPLLYNPAAKVISDRECLPVLSLWWVQSVQAPPLQLVLVLCERLHHLVELNVAVQLHTSRQEVMFTACSLQSQLTFEQRRQPSSLAIMYQHGSSTQEQPGPQTPFCIIHCTYARPGTGTWYTVYNKIIIHGTTIYTIHTVLYYELYACADTSLELTRCACGSCSLV